MMKDENGAPKGEINVNLGFLLTIAIVSVVLHAVLTVAAGAVVVVGSIHTCYPEQVPTSPPRHLRRHRWRCRDPLYRRAVRPSLHLARRRWLFLQCARHFSLRPCHRLWYRSHPRLTPGNAHPHVLCRPRAFLCEVLARWRWRTRPNRLCIWRTNTGGNTIQLHTCIYHEAT